MDLSDFRESYKLGSLNTEDVKGNPIDFFKIWLEHAVASTIQEPNAMVLSTIYNGFPRSRVVLLKEVTTQGFVFYTNYLSDKGVEMSNNSAVCLNFLWKGLERQVRIEGKVCKVSQEKSKAYFHSRPRGSQIGAWVSKQSSIIENRKTLEDRKQSILNRYEGLEIPLPDFWGGYLVEPSMIEFWQGRDSRLHDRIRCDYDETTNKWLNSRRSP